jgi:hypothetical protein
MGLDVTEIKNYEYYVFSSRDSVSVNAQIDVFRGDKTYLAGLKFAKDPAAPLPPPALVHSFYFLYYTYQDLPVIVDMLRNEGPVFLFYNDFWGTISAWLSTSAEPVGEGETTQPRAPTH